MKLVKEVENKLLKRKEIEALFENSPNLKKAEVLSQLSKKTKADEKLIVIEKMKNHFGSRDILVEAIVYENEEALNKITRSHIKKRMEKATAKPVEEAAAE